MGDFCTFNLLKRLSFEKLKDYLTYQWLFPLLDDKTENEENEQNKEEEEDPIIELPQHVPERRGKHKRKKEMR